MGVKSQGVWKLQLTDGRASRVGQDHAGATVARTLADLAGIEKIQCFGGASSLSATMKS